MVVAPVKPGDILAGKYRVERVLGAGGMGVVVAATHLELLEPRALKFMISSAFPNAEAASRFLREARAAAKLKSEHIAKVYDTGRLDDGAPYMVMEYLEGRDLEALLDAQSPLPAPIAALYAIQVCSALAEAHAAGIIHRDLKPANLFLTHRTDGSPCVKVLDFGISKIITPGAEFDAIKTQHALGSPLYMSPEQMRAIRSIDARSDIWSLGVILYNFVTAEVPFRAESLTELVSMVLEASPAPPSHHNPALPPDFDAMILRCLRRHREERYANVVELAADLARFAPPGATAAVEAMARVFTSARPMPRPSSSSALLEDPRHSGNPAPPIALPAQPPAEPAEPTTAPWAQRSTRLAPRLNLPRILMVILASSVVAGVIAILWVLRYPNEHPDRGAFPSVPSGPSPAGAVVSLTALTRSELPAPSMVPAPTADLLSTGEVPEREAPAQAATATVNMEPPLQAAKNAPAVTGKSAPPSSAKPPSTAKSMLGGTPVF